MSSLFNKVKFQSDKKKKDIFFIKEKIINMKYLKKFRLFEYVNEKEISLSFDGIDFTYILSEDGEKKFLKKADGTKHLLYT